MTSSARSFVFLSVFALGSLSLAHAGTITIQQNSNAPTSNFQNPGSQATVGYTIGTSDSGGNFYVNLFSADPNALQFSNLYFDTIASTPNTGSNLGFQFGANSQDAFDPNSGTMYSLAGTGVTSSFTTTASGQFIAITIPNSFFLNNPLGMPFTRTPDGTLVSLHLSQSFGYSVVGGSANFPAPVELGDALVGSVAATPEPSSLMLLGTGTLSMFGFARRRFFQKK